MHSTVKLDFASMPPAVARPPQSAEQPSSDRYRLSVVSVILLNLFLACQWFSMTRQFFIKYLGDTVNLYAAICGYASIVLLVPIVLDSNRKARKIFGFLSRKAIGWLLLVLSISTALVFYGWISQGYSLKETVQDY